MIKLQVCLHVNCGAGKFYINVPCQMENRYSPSKITRSVFLLKITFRNKKKKKKTGKNTYCLKRKLLG